MTVRYEDDVAAWAEEQVALLRAGKWSLLDIDHLKNLPEIRPWQFDRILSHDYLPS